jgi:hypothetical protein
MKECHQLKKEYMSIVKYQSNARIVISHPRESSMEDKSRKEWPAPFNKAKKNDFRSFYPATGRW